MCGHDNAELHVGCQKLPALNGITVQTKRKHFSNPFYDHYTVKYVPGRMACDAHNGSMTSQGDCGLLIYDLL